MEGAWVEETCQGIGGGKLGKSIGIMAKYAAEEREHHGCRCSGINVGLKIGQYFLHDRTRWEPVSPQANEQQPRRCPQPEQPSCHGVPYEPHHLFIIP
jgi:hypothetical protein